jgi:hypothetical protein
LCERINDECIYGWLNGCVFVGADLGGVVNDCEFGVVFVSETSRRKSDCWGVDPQWDEHDDRSRGVGLYPLAGGSAYCVVDAVDGLFFRRRSDFDSTTWFGWWVYVLMLTNTVSLVIDYVDVIRYALGDRA